VQPATDVSIEAEWRQMSQIDEHWACSLAAQHSAKLDNMFAGVEL
jgi:hypothetical protein